LAIQKNEFIKKLEQFVPLSLQREWDNSGIQIALEPSRVSRVLVALDASRKTVEEAIEKKADFLLTHHPLFFIPAKRLDVDSSQGALAVELIRAGISLYSAHTTFDAAPGGMNDRLASALGLQDVNPLAGVGDAPMVRVGKLPEALPFGEVCEKVKTAFGIRQPLRVVGDRVASVQTVAICGGGGGSLLDEAYAAGADLYITGDIRHHEALFAKDASKCLIDAGHAGTEKIFIPVMADYLRLTFKSELEVLESTVNPNPMEEI
jgi:dinuclear metal center YbgI/SA1388 family protein